MYYRIRVTFNDGGIMRYIGALPNDYMLREHQGRLFTLLELIGFLESFLGVLDVQEVAVIPVPGITMDELKKEATNIWR